MSKAYLRFVAAITVACLLGASSVGAEGQHPFTLTLAKPESVGFSSERLAKLRPAIQAQIDNGKYAGAVTMVARHGKIVNFDALGYRDLATKTPMRKDTIFRAASMTKPILGAAMMILYEDGKWQMDDPVSKFIPAFAHMKVMTDKGVVDAARSPTMRELLTNTSGIAGGMRNPPVTKMYEAMDRNNLTLAEMVDKLVQIPLSFQPGTDFEYGISQDVVAQIAERISGLPFDEFLRQRVFIPLGMKDTDFYVPAEKHTRLASSYQYDSSGTLIPAQPGTSGAMRNGDKPKYLSGAGGLYSTPEDYMRFAQMLMNGGVLDGVRLLSPATIKLMTCDLLPAGVPQNFLTKLTGLGYGVEVGVVLDPGRASSIGGPVSEGTYYWSGYFGSWWYNDPKADVTIIGFAQQDGAAFRYAGIPHPAPDLRALSVVLTYAALTEQAK
jgi:CubicO group peptidase (beta-lactamase class C family)